MSDMTMTLKIALAVTLTVALTLSVSIFVIRKNAKGKASNFADAQSAGGDMTGGNKIDNRKGKVEVGGDLVFGDKKEVNIHSHNPKAPTPKK